MLNVSSRDSIGACVSVVGWGRGFQSRWGGFFNLPNPSSSTMTLGPTQPLTEMSIRNLPGGGGKGRPARKADNLTSICEPIVERERGGLDASQHYGPSRPVTETALPFFLETASLNKPGTSINRGCTYGGNEPDLTIEKTKLRGFSPQANYTDRSKAVKN
jgi:hypothetical protein